MSTEEKNGRRGEEEQPASYGGYEARHQYEKKTRHPWQTPALAALYLLLFLLSVVGLITLFRGSFFSDGTAADQGAADKVTVPVVNNREITPENAIAAAEETLVTVKVTGEGGSVTGTGFVISEGGYAVCHDSLVSDPAASVTTGSGDGVSAPADVVGHIPALGVAVLRLDPRFSYHSIALGNSTIRRGQILYGVASFSRGTFYGLTQMGIAVSTAESVTVTIGEERRSIPILYTSIPFDKSLNGALAVTENGHAAGFLTDSVPGRGGGMAAVPVITLVGLVNEIIK